LPAAVAVEVAVAEALVLRVLPHLPLLQAQRPPPNCLSLKLYLKKNLYLQVVKYPALAVIRMKQPTQQRQV
jgi:hypothetical protein